MRAISIRVFVLAGLWSLAFTAAAQLSADEVVWPSSGKFPAYPAEPDDRRVRFSVVGGVLHDSNVFRLSNSVNSQTAIGSDKKSDTVRRLGAGVKGDIPVGRQHFVFDGVVEDHEYSRFNVLDHVAYGLGAAWNWLVASDWSGDVGYTRRREINTLDLGAPIKDLVTGERAFASAAYQFTPRWRLRGAADWYRWEHSAQTRSALDRRANVGTIGLDYVTPALNSLGGQVKYTQGEYPTQQSVAGRLINNDFDEVEVSAVMRWIATGVSTVNARLGYTSRKHTELTERDFSGVTGRLAVDWTPAGKTLVTLATWREIRAPEDITATYVLSHGISVGPRWAPTIKLVFQADLLYERRDFEGDPGLVLTPGVQREDKFRGGRVLVGYMPFRNTELTVWATRGKRTSNFSNFEFDYNQVAANLRVLF